MKKRKEKNDMRRAIYISTEKAPYCETRFLTFDPYKGMNITVKRRNAQAAADLYVKAFHGRKPLEVSSASDCEEGIHLSALKLTDKKGYTVECKFQSAKTFEHGGPYTDLLTAGRNPKRDERLKNSGKLICFTLFDVKYPLQPATAFYDWIYIQTLADNPALASFVSQHDTFSDISFNPERQYNCQAEACAVYSGLVSAGIDPVMPFHQFVKTVWHIEK